MNILYQMASQYVRTLKNMYDDRLLTSIQIVGDEFSGAISFKTIYEENIMIEKWDKPNLTFRVTINNQSYGKKNYLLDRFLIKKIYNNLKSESDNNF